MALPPMILPVNQPATKPTTIHHNTVNIKTASSGEYANGLPEQPSGD
jgi:hypothetical protein